MNGAACLSSAFEQRVSRFLPVCFSQRVLAACFSHVVQISPLFHCVRSSPLLAQLTDLVQLRVNNSVGVRVVRQHVVPAGRGACQRMVVVVANKLSSINSRKARSVQGFNAARRGSRTRSVCGLTS